GRLLPSCSGEPIPPRKPDPRPEPDPGLAHAIGVILSVPALCGGCGRCALACSALHGDGPGASQALVGPDPLYQQLQFSGPYWQAATCHQCPQTWEESKLLTPACVASCPRGAARIAASGHPLYGDSRVRYIETERCIGCGLCREHCPYQHPLLIGGRAAKCDLCLGRFPRPPCVEACPSRALRFVSPWADEVAIPYDWLTSAAKPPALAPGAGLAPGTGGGGGRKEAG
ncbi:MAG: hypothetical protein FJ125_04210, partial [Deltaproteobacteria bacterium]|nr:hypothetical protein [Deltaproteobacteria bacterium]